jgi:hypothetical protein
VSTVCEGCAGGPATGVAWCCFRYLCRGCHGTGHQCRACGGVVETVLPLPTASVAPGGGAVGTAPAGRVASLAAGPVGTAQESSG